MCRLIRFIGPLAVTLVCMAARPAPAATLTVGSVSGAPGTKVAVPISYDGEPASSVQFTLALDRAAPGGAPPLSADPVPAPGTAPIVDLNTYDEASATGFAQSVEGTLKAGVLMTLSLTVPDAASDGTVYTLTLTDVSAQGAKSESLPVKGIDGALAVKGKDVASPPLAKLSVFPDAITLTLGGTQAFVATAADSGGQPVPLPPVTWQVDRQDLAQIDETGVLTALGPGTVRVTATAGNVSGAATLTIGAPAGMAPADVVSAGSASGQPGGQVDVPIVLEGATDLAELDLSLRLADPAAPPLTVVGIKAAEGVGVSAQLSPTDPSQASIVLLGGETALAAGTLATLTLGIPAGAGGSYALNPVVLRARDAAGNEFVLSSKAGALTVAGVPPTGVRGDANGDGRVNVGDAILTLRIAVGLDQPTATQSALLDINGDKVINVRDALLILQFAVGLLKTL